MNRNEALKICKEKSVCIKLSWWDDFMYIYYSDKDKAYKSGGGEFIDLKFLQDGEFEILENEYNHLGGLFSL